MPITIRKAKKEDHGNLNDLFCEIEELHRLRAPWKFHKPKKEAFSIVFYNEILSNEDALFLIAEAKNEIIGFVFGAAKKSADIPILKRRRYFHVDTLMVKSEHRKKGIGKRLMKKIEILARKKGIREIELDVWDFNSNAASFYEGIDYSSYLRKMRKVLK